MWQYNHMLLFIHHFGSYYNPLYRIFETFQPYFVTFHNEFQNSLFLKTIFVFHFVSFAEYVRIFTHWYA